MDKVSPKWMWVYTSEARILHFTLRMINALQVWEICTTGIMNILNSSVKEEENLRIFKKRLLFSKISYYRAITMPEHIHVYLFCLCLKMSPVPHPTLSSRFVSPYHPYYHPLSPTFNRFSLFQQWTFFCLPLLFNFWPSSNLFWNYQRTSCFLQIILVLLWI